MAEELISTLAAPFEPERYRDEHRERVLELLDRKAEGKETVARPHVERPGKVVDLMAALQKSLASAKKPPDRAKRAAAKPKTRRRAA